MEPTASSLVAEAAGTVPPPAASATTTAATTISRAPTPPPAQSTSTIRLPDGSDVPRPVTKPCPHLYSRVPAHLLNNTPDGGPAYLPMLLTSSVYSILPPEGTPLTEAKLLGQRMGCRVWFKREDMTPVFSFKLRGALNLMSTLSEDERWKGVVACSAGNHAQGVALSGARLGIPCTIVMPLNTPSIKHLAVSRLGAKVVLSGGDFDAAKVECARLAKEHGLMNVPPFDDPHVIAGQGTAAVEILRQVPDIGKLDGIFVAVGGGGLLAGVVAYIRAVAPPTCKVIGVETFDADALHQSLKAGERVTLGEVGLFADGTAVRQVGEESFRVAAAGVDEIVLVSNDEICAAIKDVFQETRSISEPSGALAVAGMKRYIATHNLRGSNQQFVSIVSGANTDFSRLRFIAERAEVGEGKEVVFSVKIPEKRGAFLNLHAIIHPRAVTEFIYRFSNSKRARILLSFTVTTPSPSVSPAKHREAEVAAIQAALKEGGMSAVDLSDNELAKSHARYLVGGKTKKIDGERMFRFEFPERQGALKKFLEGLGQSFNISLFHYRNQGGDIGKILCGIQVPADKEADFNAWLDHLQYPYVEETENEVYKDFFVEDEEDDDDEVAAA